MHHVFLRCFELEEGGVDGVEGGVERAKSRPTHLNDALAKALRAPHGLVPRFVRRSYGLEFDKVREGENGWFWV